MKFYTILASLFTLLLVGVMLKSTSPPGFVFNQESSETVMAVKADTGYSFEGPLVVQDVYQLQNYHQGVLAEVPRIKDGYETEADVKSENWLPPPLDKWKPLSFNSQLFENANLGKLHIDPGRKG